MRDFISIVVPFGGRNITVVVLGTLYEHQMLTSSASVAKTFVFNVVLQDC